MKQEEKSLETYLVLKSQLAGEILKLVTRKDYKIVIVAIIYLDIPFELNHVIDLMFVFPSKYMIAPHPRKFICRNFNEQTITKDQSYKEKIVQHVNTIFNESVNR